MIGCADQPLVITSRVELAALVARRVLVDSNTRKRPRWHGVASYVDRRLERLCAWWS